MAKLVVRKLPAVAMKAAPVAAAGNSGGQSKTGSYKSSRSKRGVGVVAVLAVESSKVEAANQR